LKEVTMSRSLALAAFLAAAPSWAGPFTATEMMNLKRISDPQASPDGHWVLFTQTDVDLQKNRKSNDLWVVSSSGGEPRRLTDHPQSTRGRWSADGHRVAFISSRDGASQVYVIEIAPPGGEARQVTSLSTEADGVMWVDAKRLLVTSQVFPDCKDDACNEKRLEEAKKGSSARVYDHLLYRHWDTWSDGRRSHLLVVPLEGGAAKDLTPGGDDVPPWGLGGPDDYDVSPDGTEVAYAVKSATDEATSTNADLYVVPSTGGHAKKIADHPGYDGTPRYSPDGARIAYRAQLRGGYESDRWHLMVYDRKGGTSKDLTPDFDREVDEIAWSRDSKTIFLLAGNDAREPIYSVPAEGGDIKPLNEKGTFGDLALLDDKTLLVTKVSLTAPSEIYRVGTDGTGLAAVTKVNDAFLSRFGLKPGESVTFEGSAGKNVQAWIVKPADFDPKKHYPLLVLIHGGPQGEWSDGWTYRWNAQIFANSGFVVFMPNPRGSFGWGQAFTDDINKDWGGRAFEDIMRGTDFAEKLPYIEKGHTVAAGASFGGYMINWIAGHTDRFKALVSHDGDFDLVASYGATEELWFPEWELGGTFWDSPELYQKWSPSQFVKNFKTPTLVIHGEKDYRVPLSEGLSMFTALQRKGVPSRLLVFPDENHWVLKPANSVRWYKEVLDWLHHWSSK
jgi:dipeptidyl aminopeptidase/acylaminoacyl peptidase